MVAPAWLEVLSTGQEAVTSNAVYQDPGVKVLLTDPGADVEAEPTEAELKGFEVRQFRLWLVRYAPWKSGITHK